MNRKFAEKCVEQPCFHQSLNIIADLTKSINFEGIGSRLVDTLLAVYAVEQSVKNNGKKDSNLSDTTLTYANTQKSTQNYIIQDQPL